MSRRRQLTDEEQALWSGFARSIAPLRQQKKSGKATMSDDRPASEPVGDHPAAKHERDHGNDVRREHQAEPGGRPAAFQYREGHRDR